MPKRKRDDADAAADPDKLVRQSAGSYRSADERFEVREADVGWFLVDTTQSNEFGQELIHGPFGTLKAVREAMPDARGRKATPMPKPRAVRGGGRKEPKAEPPAPPPSWIDQLPKADAARVRLLVRALEGEGIEDAEALVRRDREGLGPTVATHLVEQRLEKLVAEAPTKERTKTRELVRRVAEILSSEGTGLPEPMPGWVLVEIGAEGPPPNRRIDLAE